MRFTKTKEKGVSIFLALVILVILLVTTFGLIDVLLRQKRTTKEVNSSAIALGAANAGIERMFYLDKRCIEDSFFCSNGMCDGKRCCKNDCSGLRSGTTIHGTVDVPNSSESATYSVVFGRNCGINTATSTGSYKGINKTISVSFGKSKIGPHLNSATGTCPCNPPSCQYYSCDEICEALDCACYTVGTNKDSAPESYDQKAVFYNTTTGHCDITPVQPPWNPCIAQIIRTPECGIGGVPPPPQQICPSAYHEAHPSAWTYCYCTGTSQ